MSVTVTCVDDQTGERETGHIEDGDFMLIVAAPCRLAHTQVFPGKGTVILTIKDRRPVPSAPLPEGSPVKAGVME